MYCGNNMVELATSTVKPWRRLAAVSYFKLYFPPPPPRFRSTTGDRRKIIIFWYWYLFWKCKHLVSVICAALKGYTAEHRPKNLKEESKEIRAKLVLIGWSGMRWTYTAKKLAKNVTAEGREITVLAVRSREKCKRTCEIRLKLSLAVWTSQYQLTVRLCELQLWIFCTQLPVLSMSHWLKFTFEEFGRS